MTTTEYADIVFTRHRGQAITIDHAPPRTRLELRVLLDRYAYLHMPTADTIVFADQVVYRITGYDIPAGVLTLQLVDDWREPARVVMSDRPLTQAEADEIRERWRKTYGNNQGANSGIELRSADEEQH